MSEQREQTGFSIFALLRRTMQRGLALFQRKTADMELAEELQLHLELATEENLLRGMNAEEARRQALLRFGGVSQAAERQREERGAPALEALWQDLRYTFRRLKSARGFALAVTLSIGLGIGANATIFSMISRFVLRPAPVGRPATLQSIYSTDEGACCNAFSWPLYQDVLTQTRSFSKVAAIFELLPASIGGKGEPQRVWGQGVTTNFFDALEIPMASGRGFIADEDKKQVAVLGYGLWMRRFGGDTAIAGKVVKLSGRPYTVTGVAPKGFHGVDMILDCEFWVPLGNVDALIASPPDRSKRNWHWLQVVARLKDGVTTQQAGSELNTLAGRLAVAYPATDKDGGFHLEQAGSLPPRDKKTVLLFLTSLMVVVLLVLAIACANVANLLFAQTLSRAKEMAVRLALGATRGRILRQIVMESVLLSFCGGVLGVLLSIWATRSLSSFHLPAPVPLNLAVVVDWRVLVYSFVMSMVAGLLFGVAPAWAASSPVMARALKGEDALARPGRRWTLRNALIVAQVAMCVVLLSATGLFLRSLQSAARITIGFRTTGILSLSVDPRLYGYSPERTIAFLHEARESIAALPGVQAVAVTDSVPLNGGNRSDGFQAKIKPKGSAAKPLEENISTDMFMITPGYFEAMGIPVIAGESFHADAPKGEMVAWINEEFARRIFGDENPVGQSIVDGATTYRVMGVTANIKSRSLGEETHPVMFRALDQAVAADPSFSGYTILVRSDMPASALAPAVRERIHALDASMAVYDVQTMEEHMRDAFFLPRLAATLFGVFGLVGLVLAGVGLYGVMSYTVSRRTREIGIRMALGAQAGAVERWIVSQGMWLAAIAIVLGLPAAFALARLFRSVLYGVGMNDPVTFVATPVFLMMVALIACWLPARRAARIDPQEVLRAE
ncbi:MAG TPA: ABC transporter permease [Acidobacteriaceae bacterium]|nr:ABC transporter permease [Acidobacteriaceae bacterium]